MQASCILLVMKNLPFLQELTEARLFQKSSDLKNKSAEEIARIVYMMIMTIEAGRYVNPSWAASYAADTMNYSPYENMHYAGTDLANLLAALNFQETFKHDMKVNKGISIPLYQINRYLTSVRSGGNRSHNEDAQFFWRLEDYLKVYSSGVLRQLRRDIGDWPNLTRANKIQVDSLLRREMSNSASSADIFQWYRANFRIKESAAPSEYRSYMDELFEHLAKSGKFTKDQLNEGREGLLENQSQIDSVKNFFEIHKRHSLTPEVGKSYAPIGITFVGPIKQLLIDTTTEIVELISMNDGQDYKFYINGKVQQFPKHANIHSSVGDTLFYATVEEANAMKTLATTQIQFPGWDVMYKIVESIDEGIDTKLDYHTELNPALWDGKELKPDVKEALGKIANKFSEFIDIKQIKILDYIITGSNCAYNYTSQSDIDLHVIVDASKLGVNPLLDPFLTAKKSLWNSGHDITVKGFTVELYAEDANKDDNKLVATGVYSLLHDKWLKAPVYENIEIDDAAVQSKAEDIMHQIDYLIRNKSTDQAEIDALWDHLKKMRRSGLEKGGEFSIENLAYKAVRNNDYFNRLSDYERNKEDEDLTLENAKTFVGTDK